MTWFHSCFASGLSPSDRGFYHIYNHLSVDCGGSIPPIEFWSWISSTLNLDGFHCPLRLTHWVYLCNFSLFTWLDANLPNELLCCFARKFSPFCIWHFHGLCSQLASCRLILATGVLEFDDSTSESPLSLLTICTHSTFSLAARYLFDTCCVLTFATCLDAHCARGLDDSVYKSLLPHCLHILSSCICNCSTLPT